MITELLLTPVFWVLGAIVFLFPDLSFLDFFDSYSFQPFIDIISPAFAIYPYWLFVLVISNVIFWIGIQFTWAVIEWLYKKIPGVN